jgi:hypothetical protein
MYLNKISHASSCIMHHNTHFDGIAIMYTISLATLQSFPLCFSAMLCGNRDFDIKHMPSIHNTTGFFTVDVMDTALWRKALSISTSFKQ